MSDDVVQTLTIDASGATQGATEWSAAMDKVAASSSGAASVGSTAAQALASMSVTMNGGAGTASSLAKQIDNLQARVDPAAAAWKQYSAAVTLTDAAVAKHVITSQQQTTILGQVTDKLKGAGEGTGNYSKQLAVMQGQLVAVAGNLGMTGVLLASMGPIGLAAAVSLGAASSAFSYLEGEADRMGALSLQMKNFSEVTDLTTDQIQALDIAGGKLGVSTDQVSNIFTRFSSAVAQLRQGTGPLFTDLDKVNPILVQQLSTTKNVADAWNLLAAAYVNADKGQQNLIAKAVGGRGNTAGTNLLLNQTAGAGGISGLQSGMQSVDLLTQQQIDQWATLKVEIDEATTLAKNNLASIYTSDVLAAQLKFASSFLQLSEAAKNFSLSGDWSSLIKTLSDSGMITALQTIASFIPGVNTLLAGANAIGASVNPAPKTMANTPSMIPNIDPFGTFAAGGAYTGSAGSPQVVSAQATALTSALGPAATYSDKLDASLKKLAADLANGAFDTAPDKMTAYGRAVAAVKLDELAAVTSAYVGALGPLASVQDQVTFKMLGVQKLVQSGIPLTQAQVTSIKNLTQANAEWSQVNAQAQAGVFDLTAATKAADDELQSQIDRKLLDPNNPLQVANAHEILAAKIQATQKAATDANPALKQMDDLLFQQAQLGRDAATQAAASAAKQLNPNGTDYLSHMNDLGPSLARSNETMKELQTIAAEFGTSLIADEKSDRPPVKETKSETPQRKVRQPLKEAA